MTYEEIVDKIENTKTAQRVTNKLVLTIEEAEFLIDMIEKVKGLLDEHKSRKARESQSNYR